MKEFWFFSFSSSLICCLKNSILKNKKDSIRAHAVIINFTEKTNF